MSVRNLIEDMQQHASERGGKCLSKEYWDDITKLKWMCAEGHTWKAPYEAVSRGAWCPVCLKAQVKKEKIIESYRALAKEKGIILISDTFIDSRTKLLWQCAEGHQWYANRQHIMRSNQHCPYCRGWRRDINDMHEWAAKRGGKCLSEKYINSQTPLEWQCANGHIWKAAPDSISLSNTWCRICSYEKLHELYKDDIEKYRKTANERGGRLLSDTYFNSHTKLLWECSKGHQWYAAGTVVHNSKSWCPDCAGHKQKNIMEMQELAARRGGKCLSKEYKNINTKLEWQCSKGHTWKAAPVSAMNVWCPACVGKTVKVFRNDIEKYRKLAMEKGGKLLSDHYINNKIPLLWECKNGHQFVVKPINIEHINQWCPQCPRPKPKGGSSNKDDMSSVTQ
jgi:hypothetical protein